MENSPVIKEFIELASIDSASRKEGKISAAIRQKLLEIGCTVHEDDVAEKVGGESGNLHAVLEGNSEGSLLFMAHMDRVQNGFGIHPHVKGDELVSDGTTILAADDLSGVVAILDGLRRVQVSPKKHPRVEVVFSVCEEIGLQGSLYLDCSKLQSKYGYVLDSPGRLGRVLDSAMGKAQMFLTITGKSAHSAYPELGISATRAGISLLSRLEDGRVDGETVINWSYFVAPAPFNTIPGEAEAKGLAMSRDNRKLQAYLDNFVRQAGIVSNETGAKIDATYHIDYHSFSVNADSPCIQAASRAFDAIGIDMKVEHGAGGFDANRLNGYGIEMIGLSTGYSKNHTTDESVVMDDLIRSGELVSQIIWSWLNT